MYHWHLLLCSFWLSGCAFEVYEIDKKPPQTRQETPSSPSISLNQEFSSDLNLKFEVVNGLAEKLGQNRVVIIDAFPIENLTSLIARAVITKFDLDQPGFSSIETLELTEGEYFLSAYAVTPETFEEQMSQPISSIVFAKEAILAKSPLAKIKVPQLFQQKATQLNLIEKTVTSAKNGSLRVLIGLDPANFEIPYDRNIEIEIFADDDFQRTPLQRGQVSTNELLISERLGSAEFFSNRIHAGKIFLRVFLDSNGNGFLDVAEPYAIHGGANPQAMLIQPDRLELVSVQLDH